MEDTLEAIWQIIKCDSREVLILVVLEDTLREKQH